MPLGNKVRSLRWQLPELRRQNFENCPLFLMFFLFFFLSSCFTVLIQKGLCGCLQAGTKRCRLKSQLWPIAVANCESAAELPIKPFSSSHSILVCRLVYFSRSFCLSRFLLFQKFRSAFLLSYLIFCVHKNTSFWFFHQTSIQFVVMWPSYIFQGSGQGFV